MSPLFLDRLLLREHYTYRWNFWQSIRPITVDLHQSQLSRIVIYRVIPHVLTVWWLWSIRMTAGAS